MGGRGPLGPNLTSIPPTWGRGCLRWGEGWKREKEGWDCFPLSQPRRKALHLLGGRGVVGRQGRRTTVGEGAAIPSLEEQSCRGPDYKIHSLRQPTLHVSRVLAEHREPPLPSWGRGVGTAPLRNLWILRM